MPTRQQVLTIRVAPDCTARQAVNEAITAGLEYAPHELDLDRAPLGIYGERVSEDTLLKEGDRVEIYRPLQQDPMELRRQRAALASGKASKPK